MPSFIQLMDNGMRALAFQRFGPLLSLDTFTKDCAFVPREIALRRVAEARADVSMEFISVWRPAGQFDWNRQTTTLARTGIHVAYDTESKLGIHTVKTVPCNLNYTVTVWSKNLSKIQDCADSYFFWIHDNPNMFLTYLVDDGENTPHEEPLELDLHFAGDDDTSPLSAAYEAGAYFTLDMRVQLDGWIFRLEKTPTVLKVVGRVWERQPEDQNILLYETEVISPVQQS
jgi:hypothetical protein